MKKVSLVVMERDREATLEKLRDAGVVHLKKTSSSSDIPIDLLGRQVRNRMALGALLRYPVKEGVPAPSGSYIPDEADIADHILTLVDQRQLLLEELPPLISEKQRVEAWGDFEPYDFAFLAEHGIRLFLYSLPAAILNRMGEGTELIVISRDKYWVKVFSVGAEIPGMDPFRLPEHSLSEITSHIDSIKLRLKEIETGLAGLAYHKNIIDANNRLILEEMEYEAARAGMETLEDEVSNIAIAGLSGFVPGEKIDVLINAARENGWTLAFDDPSPDDRPPTILRNSPVVRIIQPLFSMLGTIPGYWEFDISFPYMVFLSVFFALIFGDAGYGLLLLGAGAAIGCVLKMKGGQFPDAAKLIMLFASCTIVWGSITGSWFGIPIQNLPPALRLFIIPPFNQSGPLVEFPFFLRKLFVLPETVPRDELKTTWCIRFFCFTVGTIQLITARVKNVRKLLPHLAALAQAGWIVAIFGIYFVVLSILLRTAFPPFAVWLIVAGVLLNLVLSEQKGGNFLKNIGKSLSNFFSIFLKAVGSFADIVSYIRLFAAGLAGGMIAKTFNSMAIPSEGLGSMGLGFVIKLFAAVIILAAGHGLNMIMSTLSLIVHGVRLNLLEYAGNHLGMEWSGYAYKPFASGQKNKE